MSRKTKIHFLGILAAFASIFCVTFLTSQETSAFTAGKSTCAYFTWHVTVNGDEIDGVKAGDDTSYLKLCAKSLDKDGKVKSGFSTPQRTDNTGATKDYIPYLSQYTKNGTPVLCLNKRSSSKDPSDPDSPGNWCDGWMYSYKNNTHDGKAVTMIGVVEDLYNNLSSNYRSKTANRTVDTKGESGTATGLVNNCTNNPYADLSNCGDTFVTTTTGTEAAKTQSAVYTLQPLTDEQKKCLTEETDADTTAKCNKPPTDPESTWYVDTSGSTPTGDSSNGNACYGNAGALGWVVCPITDSAFGALNSIYGWVEESFLKIDAQALFDENNGVLKAWEAFRNIANIVFIILLIVVILSQLTGFGIDNYGIKKILPKIIIVAVLINLSYIFCQLAVDVSNIIGVSLREFLAGLVTPDYSQATPSNGMEGWVLAGYAGGATLVVGTALGGLGMIIAILGAAIAGVIAIFFLWLILVIREGGIVLLIALAPLAIACYLLPNTEKLGKRWLDIFKALLLLYPLSSLLIGAGILASNILGSVDNETMRLAAMVVRVVPFFFIPMLLKNSLSAMGNIGAKLSGIGKSVGAKGNAGFRRVASNTNFAKNRQENALRRRTQLANDFLPGSKRTKARRLGVLNAIDEQHKKDARMLWRDEYGNFDLNKVQEAYRDADAKGDTIARQAALEAWSETNSATLANAITKGEISSQGIAYAKSNGTIRKALSTDNVALKAYFKDLDKPIEEGGFRGSYENWARPVLNENGEVELDRETNAVQNASVAEYVAQDHTVAASQAERGLVTDNQRQQLAESPTQYNNLQGDVREALGDLTPYAQQNQESTQPPRRGSMGSGSATFNPSRAQRGSTSEVNANLRKARNRRQQNGGQT